MGESLSWSLPSCQAGSLCFTLLPRAEDFLGIMASQQQSQVLAFMAHYLCGNYSQRQPKAKSSGGSWCRAELLGQPPVPLCEGCSGLGQLWQG